MDDQSIHLWHFHTLNLRADGFAPCRRFQQDSFMLDVAFVVNVELGGAGCRAFGVCRCGLLLASQGRAGIARHPRERLAVAGRGGAGGWLRAGCAGGLRLGRIGQGLKAAAGGSAGYSVHGLLLDENPDIRAVRRLYVIFIPCNIYVSFMADMFVKLVNCHFSQTNRTLVPAAAAISAPFVHFIQ